MMRGAGQRLAWALVLGLCTSCDGGDEPEDTGGSGGSGDTEASGTGDTEDAGDTDADPCPDVVMDGSFEDGPLTEAWSFGSTNFDSPICNATCYTGVSQAFEGDWWVWFGGVPVVESAFVSQTIPLVAGRANLTFQLKIQAEAPSVGDSLTFVVDGVGLFTATAADSETYAEYIEVAIDLAEFADNKSHLISFDAEFDGMSTTSFFVDTVELHNCQ